MKRAMLLMVVPALLVALGFAQTPAASINTDQTNIKGCLGGSDGNYTIAQDNTGRVFKITSSSVDLKPQLGHDVTLIGHKANEGSSAADNSFAVTELNLISEHCAAAAAAPAASISTVPETVVTPAVAAASPAATVTTPAETVVTPAAAATPPAETVAAPSAPSAEAVGAAPAPAETVVTPPADAVVPAANVLTPSETVSMPAKPARTPAARPRRLPATAAAATVTPDVTASTSSETVVTPEAAVTTPAATASTPAAADTTPAAPGRSWPLWLLIPFVLLILAIGTMVPLLGKWRKQKMLERTGAQNLSFNREESSDKNKIDKAGPRKAA